MIGTRYPSEKKTYVDPKSGLTITQLTQNGINFHMYFTDNSFDPACENIYFLSNRANPGEEKFQLFKMNLESGEMIQLTDLKEGVHQDRVTKTVDGTLMAFVSGDAIHIYETATGKDTVIYEEKEMKIDHIFFNCDNTKLGITRNEDVDVIPSGGANYAGFKDRLFGIKDGRVSVINVDGTDFHDVFCDTHWLSHFQYAPDDPDIAMFCHEGPWNYVHQRIWMINMKTGKVWPCFRQGEDDCVGHEFWSEGGDIIFDNRRGGHDGTISSSKEQVYASEKVSTEIPYFGYAHKDGKVYKKIDMPYYCNHYFGNKDLSLFVGDAVEDIVLIKPEEDGSASLRVLANHNTTWTYQRSHCHPNFSWDGTMILYSADTDRWHDNIFLVKVPEDMR